MLTYFRKRDMSLDNFRKFQSEVVKKDGRGLSKQNNMSRQSSISNVSRMSRKNILESNKDELNNKE